MLSSQMNHSEILDWLKETDSKKLSKLFEFANNLRKEMIGNEIHLRGLIEVSNYCSSGCAYCGLNAKNKKVDRYRLKFDEIINSAKLAVQLNYPTIVMQGGEDLKMTGEWFFELIKTIKKNMNLAVTLSLGERKIEDYLLWKKAGVNRYLLRFETSDEKLYEKIHGSGKTKNSFKKRIDLLLKLKEIGFETGSGVMVGIPGQSFSSIADDILLFKKLGLHMIGVGPWLSHPDTLLGNKDFVKSLKIKDQVPNTAEMTLKVMALTRIINPKINIPSTTALAVEGGVKSRISGLECGANVIMPNITPEYARNKYEIYPGKATLKETAIASHEKIINSILDLGRTVGKGAGHSKAFIS